jgi:hypothetical protein
MTNITTLAAQDVLAERQRQVNAEGYEPEHDDEHVNGEIGAMAAFYAMPDGARDWPATETGYGETFGEAIKPEGWEGKTGDRRRELVKAGALILAEIERLDRAATSDPNRPVCASTCMDAKFHDKPCACYPFRTAP